MFFSNFLNYSDIISAFVLIFLLLLLYDRIITIPSEMKKIRNDLTKLINKNNKKLEDEIKSSEDGIKRHDRKNFINLDDSLRDYLTKIESYLTKIENDKKEIETMIAK